MSDSIEPQTLQLAIPKQESIKQPEEVLVRVENLSKKFCRSLKRSLWYGVKDMVGEVVGGSNRDTLRKDEFWAVKDVNFELRRGECLGLIGHNGAGKSTLLKMLNGLIKPDQGRIEMNGRVGALIELGAGFNPVLTGRENVYINGQILGFTKKEIDARYDAIVEFAELHDFMEMPVQNYSSGMKVRLGFAVAAQMEPDILIIDEVLAVGDLGFRLKCLNKIGELVSRSSVIFVSHSMPQVSRICTACILLDKGKITSNETRVSQTIANYYNLFDGEEERILGRENVKMLSSLTQSGEQIISRGEVVNQGAELKITVELQFFKHIETFKAKIFFVNNDMRTVLDVPSEINSYPFTLDDEGRVVLTLSMSTLQLNAGKYDLALILQDSVSDERLYRHDSFTSITVQSNYISWSDSIFSGEWIINNGV